MPLLISGERIPPRWAEKISGRAGVPATRLDGLANSVKIAFVNNMPDAALEDTEMQFFELLDTAAGAIPIHVKLYSLPRVPRGEQGIAHLDSFYSAIGDLLSSKYDGVIITGTEPHHSDLRKEPYWQVLTGVFDWAEHNTTSAVLSCLAAHASVLHSDAVVRHPLADKQFGVFEERKVSDHPLTSRTAERMRFPHSRWNEVRADELASRGYSVLTESAGAGVNLFVKKKTNSLFVHFQGHPEYGVRTLLKEYRRDVRRFLKCERETYPLAPEGYFDSAAQKTLADFREQAIAERREDLIASFPEAAVAGTLRNAWHASSIRIYRNWLKYIASNKTSALSAAAMASGRTVLARSSSARTTMR